MNAILPAWVVVVLIGWAIGATKGRGAFGLVASAFLGPLGWVFALCARPARRTITVEALYGTSMPFAPSGRPPAPGIGTLVERYAAQITQEGTAR